MKAQGSSESEAEGRSSDDNQQKKSKRTWKTPISSKTKTKTKTKSKDKSKDKDKDTAKEGDEKSRVKELRRRSTVKRSNSLDSLTMRTQVRQCWGSFYLFEFLAYSIFISLREESFCVC